MVWNWKYARKNGKLLNKVVYTWKEMRKVCFQTLVENGSSYDVKKIWTSSKRWKFFEIYFLENMKRIELLKVAINIFL